MASFLPDELIIQIAQIWVEDAREPSYYMIVQEKRHRVDISNSDIISIPEMENSVLIVSKTMRIQR